MTVIGKLFGLLTHTKGISNKMKKYYIQVSQIRKGPFDLEQIMKEMVKPETLVWHDGLLEWKKAKDIPELKPVIIQQKDRSASTVKFSQYKWFIFVLIILFILVMAARYSSNSVSPSKEVVYSPEVQKEISEQEATSSNPADDEVKRVQNQADQVENNKRYIRNNWTNYFKSWRSGYKTETLGGISDLRVYFENKTGYLIDNVYAGIDIYTANGYIYKTESIYFTNVPAYKTVSYKVPYSNRGTSVGSPRINSIESSLINFCYPPYNGNKNIDVNDPFRCHQ